MTEPEPVDPPTERRAFPRGGNELANSSPDVNHLAMSLIEKFLAIKSWYSTTFAAFLATIWKIAIIGVPAMVTGAILLDKWQEGQEKERAYQTRMFELQTDIELKKMDRTMLGDGAMSTLVKISEKLDQQSNQTTRIQLDVSKLANDVQDLRKAQAATDRRVGGLAASQDRMRERMAQPTE